MRFHELNESNRSYVYHGTDINSAFRIIADGMIDGSQHYSHHVVGVGLTRDYVTALDFGRIWDRQFPVVFVFDQQKLIDSPLKIAPRRDTYEPGKFRNENGYSDREAEEFVVGDLPLAPYLVSINIPEHEIRRALTKAGEEYRDYLSSEGWDDVSKRRWATALERLLRHPKLNAVVPRIDGSWRSRQNSSNGYWQLSEAPNERMAMTDVIHTLLKDWGQSPIEITRQEAYDFALAACRMFGPGADWVESGNFCHLQSGIRQWDERLVSVNWPPCHPLYGLTWDDIRTIVPEHSWILYNDRHYDAECSKGTFNFFELPRFERVFSQLAIAKKAA